METIGRLAKCHEVLLPLCYVVMWSWFLPAVMSWLLCALTYLIIIIRSVRRDMILWVGPSEVSIVPLSSGGEGLSVSCIWGGLSVSCIWFWVLRRLVCIATRLALLLRTGCCVVSACFLRLRW